MSKPEPVKPFRKKDEGFLVILKDSKGGFRLIRFPFKAAAQKKADEEMLTGLYSDAFVVKRLSHIERGEDKGESM